MGRHKNDLVGKTFGRLTVIGNDGINPKKVFCRCDCGKVCAVYRGNLINGHTRSCGCLKKENPGFVAEMLASDKLSKNNTSGHRGISYRDNIGKYEAYIGNGSRKVYLGIFGKEEDAVKARLAAEDKFFRPIVERAGLEYVR